MLKKIQLIIFLHSIIMLNCYASEDIEDKVYGYSAYGIYAEYMERFESNKYLVEQIKNSYSLIQRCNQHCNYNCFSKKCDPMLGCHDHTYNYSYSEEQKKEKYYKIIENLKKVRVLKEMPLLTGFSSAMTVRNSFQIRGYLDRLKEDTQIDDDSYFKDLFERIQAGVK
jgi:hypothetical protein